MNKKRREDFLSFSTPASKQENQNMFRYVRYFSGRKWLVISAIVLFSIAFFVLLKTRPSGFVPEEDMGAVFVSISLPPAASLERTAVVAAQVDSIARTIPQVNNILRLTGFNFIAGSGSSYGMVILDLKKWKERKGITNVDIIQTLIQKTSVIKDARLLPFSRPTIQGFGISGGFTFELQNIEGHTIEEFNKAAQDFLAALNKRPEIMTAYTTFNPNFPQYLLSVNVPKVKQAGLTVSGIMSAMQGFFGGIYVSNYNQFGKQYRIMVQSDAEYRTNPETLNRIMVRTNNNNMAPITEFITLTRVYGPERLSRFNMYLSISVNGSPNKGYGSGDAMKAISEVAAQTLPAGIRI